MYTTYVNHSTRVAQSRLERGSFLAHWWRIYAGDPYWAPPYYPILRRELEPSHNRHLARTPSIFMYTEALPRRQASSGRTKKTSGFSGGPLFERPVAAALALCDPRLEDGTARLALLRCVNHVGSLEHLLDRLAEELRSRGCRRIVGPTGLSAHLEIGLLEDHWNQLPPLHTSYNPPYLPELVGGLMQPLGTHGLYHLKIPTELPPSPPDRAQLSPFDPSRLAKDLLPLLTTACSSSADSPPPDAEEVAFILRWLGLARLHGWLALVEERPVGFILLQPDLAPLMRRANGGRHLPWRLWLAWRSQGPLRRGRVIFGAVSPRWRGQGVGVQLLHQALVTAQRQGWETLSIGPLSEEAPACAFLENRGAHPRQTYGIYQRDL